MLIGEFPALVGDKNRIALPKRLRDQFKGKIFITRGYEKCLLILDSQRWEGFMSEIDKRPLLSLDVRDTKRFILGGANEIEYDTQGRFVIPETLKIFADIQEKIIFIGVGEWVEVWSENKWRDKLDKLSENVSDIANRLN